MRVILKDSMTASNLVSGAVRGTVGVFHLILQLAPRQAFVFHIKEHEGTEPQVPAVGTLLHLNIIINIKKN